MEAQPPFQQPNILQNSVVVFSKNYLPLARINIKRAIVLLVTGQAESVNFGTTKQWEISSPSVVLQVPEHIRLTVGNPERHWKVPPVNRREVLRRDNQTCQYCGSTKHSRASSNGTGMYVKPKMLTLLEFQSSSKK